jgi:hypothetical protein
MREVSQTICGEEKYSRYALVQSRERNTPSTCPRLYIEKLPDEVPKTELLLRSIDNKQLARSGANTR